MAIEMTRILARRPGTRGRAPTSRGIRPVLVTQAEPLPTGPLATGPLATGPLAAQGSPGEASSVEVFPAGRPAAGDAADALPRRAGGLPHDVVFRDASSRRAAVRQVWVEADEDAVLADWGSRGRVELMAARRPFVLEADVDGRGVRLVEPMGLVPVAAFTPERVGGRVRLADGASLRWLEPTRAEFASGLVGHREVNIIRFALDGTALVIADPDLLDPQVTRVGRVGRVAVAGPGDTRRGDAPDPRLGWVPDVVALLVLGWFLRLLERTPAAPARSYVRHLGV
ncbi:conserved hypothetical protein [Frankia canadensis]|uniref:Uncharacterized protein n=1 Tax=Frankia canadensis TaxID=1836972 RepID=A0A2I2KMT0_9ACTN|nr:hypothetical protein [Frankia canadensis]SNQ46966.1 conserved hypothetical protein [Frankia canadensis]SOU54256.1 conserved hypothetical protein [Frankia canadensis]